MIVALFGPKSILSGRAHLDPIGISFRMGPLLAFFQTGHTLKSRYFE